MALGWAFYTTIPQSINQAHNKTGIKTMSLLELALKNQDELNKKIHPQWRDQKFNWRLAIFMECAELIDHFNWKWWAKDKKEVSDFQIKLELIDIFHFCLSHHLGLGYSVPRNLYSVAPDSAFHKLVDWAAEYATRCINLTYGANPVLPEFLFMWANLGLTENELFKLYFAKTALNEFRQEKGYNQGIYNKCFLGKEDNLHLEDILKSVNEAALSNEKSICILKELIKFELKELYEQDASNKAGEEKKEGFLSRNILCSEGF